MQETTNYKLKKIELPDSPPDITTINPNWDTIDTKLKAAADHAASTANPHGVTKSQVGLGNVDNTSDTNKPVSTAQQTALNGKANASHNHAASNITSGILALARGGTGGGTAAAARTNLGAAPSGYGLGEVLWDNKITNALDTSLPTGIYGWWDGISGGANFPEGNFVGFAEIEHFNSQWRHVTASNIQTGNVYDNWYQNTSGWSGWQLRLKMTWGAPYITDFSSSTDKTLTIALPFAPTLVIMDTSINTASGAGTNKTCIIHNNENVRNLVYTSTGQIKATVSGSTITVTHRVNQAFGFKYLALGF